MLETDTKYLKVYGCVIIIVNCKKEGNELKQRVQTFTTNIWKSEKETDYAQKMETNQNEKLQRYCSIAPCLKNKITGILKGKLIQHTENIDEYELCTGKNLKFML